MITITAILSLFFVCYASLLLYYRYCWKSIPDFKMTIEGKGNTKVFISVIVPARNEDKNILALLESLRRQTYPQSLFEVIVIDDHSTDQTAVIVETAGLTNLHLIRLKDVIRDGVVHSFKKMAIETGIGASKGSVVVTTDADCVVPAQWLQHIADAFAVNDAAMIVMPVVIAHQKNFIGIFQALDFMTLQGITGAAVYRKRHSMCNGANLAYTKKAFYDVGGFRNIDHIASGDDMLLMQKMVKNELPVFYLKSTSVIVSTQAVSSVKAFFQQRIRWASKADKYEDKSLFPVLLMVYLFNAAMLVGAVLTPFFGMSMLYAISMFLILKTGVELLFIFPVAEFFKMKKQLWYFPFMQPFHILYTVVAGWLGKFGSYQWKGRNVR